MAEPALRLGGALVGLGAGAFAAGHARLRTVDLAAGAAGVGYGALWGGLAASLDEPEFALGRRETGGAHLGLALGGAGAALAAHLTDASGETVAVPAVAAGLGGLAGLGLGLALPGEGDHPARAGALAGSLVAAGGALALSGPLRLREGFAVPGAAGFSAVGGALGAGEGLLLAAALDEDGGTGPRQRWGGALFGASVGGGAGLVLARYFEPTPTDHAVATLGGAAGGALGLGTAMLLRRMADAPTWWRPSRLARRAGGGRAHAAPHASGRRGRDGGAGRARLRRALGRARAYPGRRGVVRVAAAHRGRRLGRRRGRRARGGGSAPRDGARPATVAVAVGGGTAGLALGAGLGMMLDREGTQGARVGASAGAAATMVGALALAGPLRLREGFAVPGTDAFVAVGGAIGLGEGRLLASALGRAQPGDELGARQSQGGALFGAAAGATSGLLLSRYFQPGPVDHLVTVAGGAAGGALGLGASFLLEPPGGRADPFATMVGSLAGIATGAGTQHLSPLESADALAAPVGAGLGGLVGALAPGLGDARWGGWNRHSEGGTLLGLSGGALGAVALRHTTGATPATVGSPSAPGSMGSLPDWGSD